MKDYSLKINGQNYTVQIDEVNDASTVAHVVVNGTAYEVEIEGAKTSAASRPQVLPAPKNANSAMITPASASPSPRIAPSAPSSGYAVKCPLPGTVLSVKVQVGDKVAGPDARRARSHEDGEQYRQRPCGRCQVDQSQPRRLRAGGRRAHNSRIGVC